MMDTWNYSAPKDPATIPDEWVWERLRHRRNLLLAESDKMVIPDAPWNVAEWMAYRQALRDLPFVTNNPRQAAWPARPEVK